MSNELIVVEARHVANLPSDGLTECCTREYFVVNTKIQFGTTSASGLTETRALTRSTG